ncbi:MAG: rhodanese-like domain-containing protein [Pseudanabaenaceae cyanobacterium]|jgi:rhodanese-related sulfurtransferase
MSFKSISTTDFAIKQASAPADTLQLIDVREPAEIDIAALPGFAVLPLSAYGDWSTNIKERFDPQQETYVLCHHGMRSAQMCGWLVEQGFTNVYNISGGIDAYAVMVDTTIPRY